MKEFQLDKQAIQGLAPYFRVNVSQLIPNCVYSHVSERAGWWCCQAISIPVEEVADRKNMSYRVYQGIHDACKEHMSTLIPFVITEATTMSASGVFFAVVGVISLLFALITVGTLVVRRIRQRRAELQSAAAAARYYAAPLIGGLGETVSTVVGTSEEASLPNLVSDVRRASQALGERLASDRARAEEGAAFFGRSCSTFRREHQNYAGSISAGREAHLLSIVSEVDGYEAVYDRAA